MVEASSAHYTSQLLYGYLVLLYVREPFSYMYSVLIGSVWLVWSLARH